MRRHAGIAGISALCVLVVSAFAVQSASAATTGTTGFTCVKAVGGTLWGEHCLGANPGAGEKQEFGHLVIVANEQTHFQATSSNTIGGTKSSSSWSLKTVVVGVGVKLKSLFVSVTATFQNKETTGEHYAQSEGKLLLSGVTVEEPANCKVTSTIGGKEVTGEIQTEQLLMTTKGQGMNILFTPKEGETVATFNIVKSGSEPCAVEMKGLKLVGSFKGQPDVPGATVTFSEVTTTSEKTLRTGSKAGTAAGVEGIITNKGGKEPESEPTNPISYTTIETP